MSLRFTLPETNGKNHTHCLSEICRFLTLEVIVPFLAKSGVRWQPRFSDFCIHDPESHPYEATGSIQLFPPPVLLGQLGELEDLVRRELLQRGVKTGQFVRESFPDGFAVRAVHIPIVENLSSGPPQVNISPTAGSLVLRDLLHFTPKAGRYEMDATEIIQRAAHVTDTDIERCSCSPVRDPKAPRKVKRLPSAGVMKRLKRCLEEVKGYAVWARDHQYHKIEVIV
jgi:hypothetical protein